MSESNTKQMIQLNHVKFGYSDTEVLEEINLTIHEGEYVVLTGENGSGKRTLMRLILGEMKPDEGEIILMNNDPRLKKRIGYVSQNGISKNQSFPATVEEIMITGLYQELGLFHLPHKKHKNKIKETLRDFGMEEFLKRRIGELSGGQQQRVAIARALVNEPKVLLLDEPLGALDAKIRKQMQVELKKIQQEVGITFIYVTHDQEEALSMSDTVVVMNNGEIQQIGSPTDIYNEPENRFVAGFIGESNIIEGTMIRDYLVAFDGFEFECVDKGFEDNEEIEVVLRPEDLDIVDPGQAKIRGIVRNITFKGVHYEILIETELRTYMVHTTDYAEVGREVGLKFGPEDIHVMCKMGSY